MPSLGPRVHQFYKEGTEPGETTNRWLKTTAYKMATAYATTRGSTHRLIPPKSPNPNRFLIGSSAQNFSHAQVLGFVVGNVMIVLATMSTVVIEVIWGLVLYVVRPDSQTDVSAEASTIALTLDFIKPLREAGLRWNLSLASRTIQSYFSWWRMVIWKIFDIFWAPGWEGQSRRSLRYEPRYSPRTLLPWASNAPYSLLRQPLSK